MSDGFDIPGSLDNAVTSELTARIAAGEDPKTEFKSRFPEQTRDLAKEIAAFASISGGLILIGIADDGTVVGLDDTNTAQERDAYVRRIQGICAQGIKPPVTPVVNFVQEQGKTLLVIEVAGGVAPLYYVQNVAYIRHLTSSRPAEPDEVIEHVLAWTKRGQVDPPSLEAEFLSSLSSLLVEILVNTSELEAREIDPWFSMLRNSFDWNAKIARSLLLTTPSSLADIEPDLEALAAALDDIVHEELGLGFGRQEMQSAAERAHETASRLMQNYLSSSLAANHNLAWLRSQFEDQIRVLAQLAARAENLIHRHRFDELKSDASQIGHVLLKLVTFGAGLGGAENRKIIEGHARALREIETRGDFADGGASVRRALAEISQANAELTCLAVLKS